MTEEYDPYEGASDHRWQPSPEDIAQMAEWHQDQDPATRRLHAVGSDTAADDAYEAAADAKFKHTNAVIYELEKMRAREEAKAILAAEKLPPPSPLVVTTADVLRKTLPTLPPARVAGVLPGNGSALLIAQAGTGKTTLLGNLARDLIDGTPFLDQCPVRRVSGRIAMLSYEMDAGELLDWFESVGVDLERFVMVDLRGRANPLADDAARLALANDLRALDVEVLMVDSFGRAFTGESQDSAADVTSWFVLLDTFTRAEVGATESVVIAHAGWSAERGRGSSALHDSPDSVLLYVKEADDTRTLRAEKYRGRGALQKVGVTFDPETLRVTAGATLGGTHEAVVLQFVEDNPMCSQSDITRGIPRRAQALVEACHRLAASGQLERTQGARNAWIYSIPATSSALPEEVELPPTPPVPAPYRGTGGELDEVPCCETCDAPTDDHLPGCPKRTS